VIQTIYIVIANVSSIFMTGTGETVISGQ